MAPIVIALLAFSACGGGGPANQAPAPSQGCDAATCGTLMVGSTDADGTLVLALPTRQRVDFAGLVDLTELVTAATVVA